MANEEDIFLESKGGKIIHPFLLLAHPIGGVLNEFGSRYFGVCKCVIRDGYVKTLVFLASIFFRKSNAPKRIIPFLNISRLRPRILLLAAKTGL